ncbi:MAG: general secretion pathway protein GspB [Dokdonella sp.]
MSLILEALKKSERERRLGEAPSIGSPVMAVRRAPNRLPLLIGLIVLALVAGWWLRRESSPSTPEASATIAVADVEPTPVDPLASTPSAHAGVVVERPRSTADSRFPHSKVAADPSAAMAPDLREKVRSGEIVVANPNLLIPGQPSTIQQSEPVRAPPPGAEAAVAAPLESWPTASTPRAAAAPPAERVAAPVMNPAPAVTSPATPPAAAAAVAAAAPTPTTPVPMAPAAGATAVKLLWELPYAQRRDIPELKVTMHVFDATPAARFIIVNGNRQVEGDELEGLKVIEIRPDGVVMESQGQRFLYPRGGR